MNTYNNRRSHLLFKILLSIMIVSIMTLAVPCVVIAQDNCVGCHSDQETTVKNSVHGVQNCTACHTNVDHFPHPDVVLDKKESSAVCMNCHKGRIADSYRESFHGKAVNLGSQEAAACTDCHGAHSVLTADDPNSKVSKANVASTCATCHTSASPGFAEGSDHFILDATGAGAPMYFTAKFFVWLTIITITALVIHIELQLYQNLRIILQERRKR